MGGAVLVTLLVTPLVTAREAPLLASTFSLPGKQLLDRRLVGGAVVFGIGWGLSGYCPGPALVSLFCGYESTVVLLGHVRGNGTGRSDQPPFRLILSAGELVGLGVTKTGPTQTV